MKKSKDIKFVIYQALYIFVVCVLAIKGADLTLTQVIEDDGKPKVILTPEKMDSIQKLLDKSIIVDTNRFAIVDKDLLKEDDKMKELVTQTLVNTGGSFVSNDKVIDPPVIVEKPIEITKTVEKDDIVIGNIDLFQYHVNIVPNQGDNPITIAGVTIPAHSTGKVTLGGESTVTITAGKNSKTVNVKENIKPKISINRISEMGANVKATNLQRNVGFRVTINDDFPEQLEVSFNGPVTVKDKGKGVYDITMNFFSSREAFDRFTENKEAPYSVGFNVNVTDKLSGHKMTGQQSFSFEDY